MKQLPLKDLHVAAGARFAPFAGYDMPISYPLGVLKEHLHTRHSAGLFDISHMSHIVVEGPEAAQLLSRACPYEAETQANGRGRYTYMLNPHAGIIDDLIVSRLDDTRFLVVANGACADKDLQHLRDLAGDFDASVTHVPRVFLALQGPASVQALARYLPDCQGLSFMQVCETGDGIFLSRSGYTGEDGFEIAIDADRATEFTAGLVSETAVEWVGLGARDSLRIEAGLPLYGNDMDEETDPVTAGLIWAVPKPLRSGGSYLGADALAAIVSQGSGFKRTGLKPQGRAPIRGSAKLYDSDGADANEVGYVTSGGFGPSCGHPVAIGRISRESATTNTRFFADVRGRRLPCDLHPLPFVPHNYFRGEPS